ncbi:MAG: cytochrome C oxidase subunit IV family protein [Acidimicrobiia bacterium]|jgi:cytochrome c oxidase subunit 4
MAQGSIERVEEKIEDVAHGELVHALEPAPGLLPGEVTKHPSPFKYVVIAVILVIVTALEVATSYLEGDIPDGLIVGLLLGMAVIKFWTVAAWYMHLQTDRPIFRRFFVLGVVAACILYAVVLASLGVF